MNTAPRNATPCDHDVHVLCCHNDCECTCHQEELNVLEAVR